MEKKGEIEKAFALDERLSGRLDDSGEGTLGKNLTSASIFVNIWWPKSLFYFTDWNWDEYILYTVILLRGWMVMGT